MEDVSPKLLEEFTRLFKEEIDNNIHISACLRNWSKGKWLEPMWLDYANNEVSKMFLRSFKEVFKTEVLPDGKLYWNIFENAVEPNLIEMNNILMKVCKEYSDDFNELNGLKLETTIPEIKQSNLYYIKNEVCQDDIPFETQMKLMDDFVPTTKSYFVDNFMQHNAEVGQRLGYSATVERIVSSSACEFCKSKAGVYKYIEVKNDKSVWMRHRGCTCLILYKNGKKIQNAITKKEYDTSISFDQIMKENFDDVGTIDLLEIDRNNRRLIKKEMDLKISKLAKEYENKGYAQSTARHYARRDLRKGE